MAKPSDAILSDADEWRKFNEIFAAYWLDRGIKRVAKLSGTAPGQGPAHAAATIRSRRTQSRPASRRRAPPRRQPENPADRRGRREGASRTEALARTDFRHIADPQALAEAHAAASRLAAALRTRLTRRHRAATAGRRLDMRRTIRRSIPRGGTPLDLVWRRRQTHPLKLVILLDASGSMSLYTAVFTRFIHGVIQNFPQSDAFLFHTRLVQIAGAMREKNPQRAIDRLSLLAEGVGGGTRIGECLAQFNRWHAKRVLTSRTVLMIVSDGYDTGEPGTLGTAMAALHKRCRRIVWLNPMIGWADYATARPRHGRGAAPHRPVRPGAQPGEPGTPRALPGQSVRTPPWIAAPTSWISSTT